jgi:hypothetical protein
MKQTQYTIRNVPSELDAKLRAKAQREKKSLNSLLIEQLHNSVRKSGSNRQTSSDYDELAGSWVNDPSFDEAMSDSRVVDPKDWQ